METFKIKAILAAAEEKSLSKAAELFSYTPSAFSHMLNAFEKELGVKLFKRSSVGVTLTRTGEVLLPRLRAILDCEKELWSDIEQLKGKKEVYLRISTYSSIYRNYLGDVLKRLQREQPQLRISINIADKVAGALETDKADMVFADSNELKRNSVVPLIKDRFYVVAPKGMLNEYDFITVEELYKYPYIDTDTYNLSDSLQINRFKKVTQIRSEDDFSIFASVREGIGLTVLPKMVLDGMKQGVNVVRLEPELSRTLAVAWDAKRIKALGLTAFVERLCKNKSY